VKLAGKHRVDNPARVENQGRAGMMRTIIDKVKPCGIVDTVAVTLLA
jgi:hypothetical protein